MNMNSAFIKLETVKEENPEQKFITQSCPVERRKKGITRN